MIEGLTHLLAIHKPDCVAASLPVAKQFANVVVAATDQPSGAIAERADGVDATVQSDRNISTRNRDLARAEEVVLVALDPLPAKAADLDRVVRTGFDHQLAIPFDGELAVAIEGGDSATAGGERALAFQLDLARAFRHCHSQCSECDDHSD